MIVNDIQKGTFEATKSMDEAMQNVTIGAKYTEQSASQFREITKEVHQIGPQMELMAQVMFQISNHRNEVTESAVELS